MQDNIYKLQSGMAQPHIYSKDLQEIKIYIPSIEKQIEIIEYLDFNNDLINKLEKEIENNKKIAEEFINNIIK